MMFHTGKRLNISKDVTIGDRVWVAYGATIWGGTKIGSGSIVGAFSVVKNIFLITVLLQACRLKSYAKMYFGNAIMFYTQI